MKFISCGRIGYLAALAAGIAIGIAAVNTAAAAPTAQSGRALGTVTRHYALAASAFAPDSLANPAQDYVNAWDPTALSNTGTRCFNAGLALPANAALKSVRFFYTEGSASMGFEVNRQNLLHHTAFLLVHSVSATTGGAPFYTSTTLKVPAAEAAVNYSKFAYSVGACPSATTTFSGIIVTYTQPG